MNAMRSLLELRADSTLPDLLDGASDTTATWADALSAADRFDRAGFGGVVGLALSDPLDMAVHILGALAAGVVIAPLDPDAPGAEQSSRIRELGLTAMVTDRPGGGSSRWPAGRADLWVTEQPTPALLPSRPADPALIMASSGSTGQPKIIPLTIEQLLTTAQAVVDHLGLTPEERGYSPLPLFHINGIVVGVLSALLADSSLVLDRRFTRRDFWARADRHRVTWLNLVPAILGLLAGADEVHPLPASSIRRARSASAPLPPAILDRFESRFGIPVIETYGMTEAASQITANPIHQARTGSVGKAVGLELRVVGPDGCPIGRGQPGQVQIRGTSVTDTYWHQRDGGLEAVDATLAGGWLGTGDVGRLDIDGYLYLEGRHGDVINRAGEKIRPREVENVLLSDERVRLAVVVGRHHPTLGEEPVAYVVPHEAGPALDHPGLADDLAARCATSLSSYKRPVAVEVTDSLPCGPTGKVRRAEMVRMANRTSIPRRTPLKETKMDSIFLELPLRSTKPRRQGLTMAIDNGVPHRAFADAVATASPYIDLVKFGWGTAIVTPDIERKFEVLHEHGIGFYFGGTLFEKFVVQDRFESFLTLCRMCGCRYVEISNGTIDLSETDKAEYISRCADEFVVLSEVGFKDAARSAEFGPGDWVRAIRQDLAAGATWVITEARESGRSGICLPDGTPRLETLDAILGSDVRPEQLIFETPTKDLQTHFINLIGPDVNVGNIALDDVIGLETLRLGLRSDTLLHFEQAQSYA